MIIVALKPYMVGRECDLDGAVGMGRVDPDRVAWHAADALKNGHTRVSGFGGDDDVTGMK